MKKNIFFFLTLSLYFTAQSQTIPLTEVGQLDDIVSEPSGLAILYNSSNGHFEQWVHNDYGNQDSIYSYKIDDLSTMTRIMDLNVDWIDWEDMTSDDEGNIYIGDFGNFNLSDELQVVKVPNPNNYSGNPPAVEVIEFVFPASIVANTEAMLHHDGFIYIFTKSTNQNTNPNFYDGVTYCFRFPDTPAPQGESHVAEYWGEHTTKLAGDDDSGLYRVTGADISPDNKKVVLITYGRVWVFSCFENADFFGGTDSYFNVDYKQYEGVSFINNHEVFISKEGALANPGYNPKLYYVDIAPLTDGTCMDCDKTRNGDFAIENMGWSKFTFGEADANLTTLYGRAEIQINTLGTSLWHINIRHKSLVLKTGRTYRVTYTAWAEDDRPISVIINDRAGALQYGYFGQNITTTPTVYTHVFTMDEATDFNSYLSFNVGRGIAHTVYFDDISLEKVDCVCPSNRYYIAAMDNTFEHFETSETIFGLNKIDNSNVIYDGGIAVELRAGFEVKAGTLFEAYIDGCGGE